MNLVPNDSWCVGDLNADAVLDQNDEDLIIAFLQAHNWEVHPVDPDWNPLYNIDCDDVIGRFDWIHLIPLVGNECPPN